MNTIFLTLLSRSLWLSGVVLILFLLRAIFRRIPGRGFYFLWLIVFIGLLCPVSLKIPYETTVSPIVHSQTQPEAAQFPEVTIPDHSPADAEAPSDQAAPASIQIHFEDVLPFLSYLWAAVALLLILGNLWNLLRFGKRLLGARRLHTNIYETEAAPVPFILGFLHPRIYLPTNLSESEQELILLHECVHLRRKDYIIKPIALLITCLHWFNPLIWLAYLLFSEDMERACDEAVLDESSGQIRKQYASSLLVLSVGKMPTGISTVAFGERRIQYRIMRRSDAAACGTFVQPVGVQTEPTAVTQEPTQPETTAATQPVTSVAYEDMELEDNIHYPSLPSAPGN